MVRRNKAHLELFRFMGGDHGFAHTRQSGAEPFRPDALRGHARAFQQQIKLVGEHLRVIQAGASAQLRKMFSLSELELFDHATRRMGSIRQLDCGIGKRAAR
jgi:hypothetical protein